MHALKGQILKNDKKLMSNTEKWFVVISKNIVFNFLNPSNMSGIEKCACCTLCMGMLKSINACHICCKHI